MERGRRRDLIILVILNFSLLAFAIAFKLIFDNGSEASPCYIYNEFGLPCPTCGGSRAVYALLGMDILSAFLYYPPLFYGIFLILHLDVLCICHIIKGGGKSPSLPKWEIIALPIVIIAFFLLRLVLLLGFGTDLIEIASGIEF